MVGRDVEHDRNSWTECLDRLQLKARNLEHHDGVRLRCFDQGDRRRADIAADQRSENHPPATISPARVVVVVLPLEPVMATMVLGRNREASSISPITGSPSARACTRGGESTGTPGLTTMRSCPRKVRSPCPPVSTAMP